MRDTMVMAIASRFIPQFQRVSWAACGVAPVVVLVLLHSFPVFQRIPLALTAGLCSFAIALVLRGPITSSTIVTMAVTGLSLQVHLSQFTSRPSPMSPAGAAGWLFLAGIAFIIPHMISRRAARWTLGKQATLWIGALLWSGAAVLRSAPGWIGGNADNGQLSLPIVRASVQIGEFTRILVIVGVGFVAQGVIGLWTSRHGLSSTSRMVAVGLFAFAVLSLVVNMWLLRRDLGPLVLVLCGLVAAVAAVGAAPLYRSVLGLPIRRLQAWVGMLKSRGKRWVLRLVGLGSGVLVMILGALPMASVQFLSATAAQRISHLDDPGHQAAMARLALTEGGLLGRGFGSSIAGPYISEARTDEVPAALAAEVGVVPVLVLLAAFLVVLHRATARTILSKSPLAVGLIGLSFSLAIQSWWSTGAAWVVLPLSGFNSPLLSATGSALMSVMIALGLIQGVAQQRPPKRHTANVLVYGLLMAHTALLGVVALWFSSAEPVSMEIMLRLPHKPIVARDGTVIASDSSTTGMDRRQYPLGDSLGSVTGRLWASVAAVGTEQRVLGTTSGVDHATSQGWDRSLRRTRYEPQEVHTTIDVRLQQDAASRMHGKTGALVVVDALTGGVLAMHSSYSTPWRDWSPDRPIPPSLATRAVSPPGGVIKPLVMALAMDAGVPIERAPARRLGTRDGYQVWNPDRAVCAESTVGGILEQACTASVAWAGVRLGRDRLLTGLSLHFDADRLWPNALVPSPPPVGPTLPGDAHVQFLLGQEHLAHEAQVARTAMGQESVRASPLGVASALSSIVRASAGTAPPKAGIDLMAHSCMPDAPATIRRRPPSRQVSPEIANTVLRGMQRSIRGQHGTLRKWPELKNAGPDIAGVTGFAEGPSTSWAAIVVQSRYVVVAQVLDNDPDAAPSVLAALTPSFATPISPLRCG